jgi:hypothetical protein
VDVLKKKCHFMDIDLHELIKETREEAEFGDLNKY